MDHKRFSLHLLDYFVQFILGIGLAYGLTYALTLTPFPRMVKEYFQPAQVDVSTRELKCYRFENDSCTAYDIGHAYPMENLHLVGENGDVYPVQFHEWDDLPTDPADVTKRWLKPDDGYDGIKIRYHPDGTLHTVYADTCGWKCLGNCSFVDGIVTHEYVIP